MIGSEACKSPEDLEAGGGGRSVRGAKEQRLRHRRQGRGDPEAQLSYLEAKACSLPGKRGDIIQDLRQHHLHIPSNATFNPNI
jgi:hypothetical protein